MSDPHFVWRLCFWPESRDKLQGSWDDGPQSDTALTRAQRHPGRGNIALAPSPEAGFSVGLPIFALRSRNTGKHPLLQASPKEASRDNSRPFHRVKLTVKAEAGSAHAAMTAATAEAFNISVADEMKFWGIPAPLFENSSVAFSQKHGRRLNFVVQMDNQKCTRPVYMYTRGVRPSEGALRRVSLWLMA